MKILGGVISTLFAFSFAACGSSGDDGSDVESVARTQEAQTVCTAQCRPGYVLDTKTCRCQAACTSTAVCVAGWHWDDIRCACVRDR